ncbi:hypothetical protein M8C21_001689, partial [Ambrosia artemisiifolia]
TLSSVPDFKLTNIFTFRTKRSRTFLYIFVGIFVAFTVFLAFNPSQNPSSPWFSNIFASSSFRMSSSSSSTVNNNTDSSSGSSGSHFKSIYSYFFPNNSTQLGRNSTGFGANLNRTGFGSGSVNSEAPTVNNNNNVNRTRSEDLKQNENTTSSRSSQSDSKQVNQTRSEDLEQNNKTTSSPPLQSDSKQINQTRSGDLKQNNKTTSSPPFQSAFKQINQTQTEGLKQNNKTTSSPPLQSASKQNNQTQSEDLKPKQKTTSSPPLQSASNATVTNATANNHGIGDLVKNLLNCDLFDGDWVRDETYPLYKPGSCSLMDQQFSCVINGRPDKGYQMLKWKPKGCTLPRLDGSHMLQLLKGKRLVFVGDSLNRNMWESLICILRNSVKDLSKVYEASGRHNFRSEPSFSFVFEDYNCTVELFVAPFIVRESVTNDKNGTKKETLRLDLIGTSADRYKTADILVFNTGHWWTHEKTAKGKDYYQEGSHVYSQLSSLEAFRKAMTTWGRWVDANINPSKTLVFFRGYSASHFRGGQWNSGGQCDSESEPIKNTTYLSPYPDKMIVLEKVLRGMKTRVSYLNITRSTDFRKDGHPSIYRKNHYSEQEKRSSLRFQDCSHWCLPGVPDSWNEMFYAELLAKQYQNQQRKN